MAKNVMEKIRAAGQTSGTRNTPESKAASRAVGALIKSAFPAPAYSVKHNTGHFYCSGFVTNTKSGRVAYYNVGDYRGFGFFGAYVRTAQSTTDYAGGGNVPVNNVDTDLIPRIENIVG